ncbi:SRPBCC family protein [Solwaraspora sp. WMMD792]|uniref:SRPBCC family protein n=1 Tax=Solwaraspora sp. WMMD792 TaxID=3016099 RepID=UPI002417966A|nr:SRPBCC family protein [Solwaraspora sp. WMMD792]MDG4772933.1 SRPBCC family protein [Solwaraspora sp. WMMD792]
MLYIETLIQAPVDQVWRYTQDPARHARWDLRFTRIEPYGSQGRFRYATRLLPGLTVAGTGQSTGERRRPDGSAASALRFTCDHRLSLIRAGHGFWRYQPTPDGVRFWTGYDYTPGWGRLGPVADRIFRPAFGWATAWSFDRLRLWLEHGVPPERGRDRALAEVAARLTLVVAAAALDHRLALLAVPLVALVPPLPGTPAARRCRPRRYRRTTTVHATRAVPR